MSKPNISIKKIVLGAAALAITGTIVMRPVPPSLPPFIQARNNRHNEIKVNTKSIRWIAKYGDAYYVCARQDGCVDAPFGSDKFVVAPAEEPESFALIKKL
jgi:hypothetical protein